MTKTRIFTNGKIYTVNEKQPWAQAVVVEDKRIPMWGTTRAPWRTPRTARRSRISAADL